MQVAVRGLGRREPEAAHGAGAAHGRRAAQPQRRRLRPAVQAARPWRCSTPKLDSGADPARARVRRRQRPLLPQHLDGGLQVDVGRRARRARQQHGHGHGAQRRQLRHPPERHRRPVVPGAGQPGRRPLLPRLHASRTPPPTSATRPSPRPTASAGSRWPRRRRSCSSSAARPPTPPRTAGGCCRITLGQQPGVHAAGAQLRRHAGGHRRAAGRRFRRAADHQHRHRAQEGRRRPDRRGHHDGADGVLQRRARGARRGSTRRDRKRWRTHERDWPSSPSAATRSSPTRSTTPSPSSTRRSAARVAAPRRPDRAGLAAGRLARQRPAGRLHPAPLRARRGRGRPGSRRLRRRRHAGRDRLHVRQGADNELRAPRPDAARRRHRHAVASSIPTTRPSQHPTKPIGSFLDEATARARQSRSAGRSWKTPAAAGGARSPSPRPRRIVETDDDPHAARRRRRGRRGRRRRNPGGVADADGTLVGVEAVVDKDLAASAPGRARRRPADHPHRRRARAIRFGSPTSGGSTRSRSTRHERSPSRASSARQHGPEGRGRRRLRRAHARRRRGDHLAGPLARRARSAGPARGSRTSMRDDRR